MLKKIFFLIFCIFLANASGFALQLRILYTGQTHALLYPCNCPKEPDGGISRRATLISELRRQNPHTLLLDAGGFFAGGLLDEYTQNTQMDIKRSQINLTAMELMKYDAGAISDDEFNFGKEFLKETASGTAMPLVSCNIKLDHLKPYMIKEIAGLRIGIIGVTPLLARNKETEIEVADPLLEVKKAAEALRSQQNIDLIILLGRLSNDEAIKLIREVKGINIFIIGQQDANAEPFNKIGDTLLIRSSWQGRKLGKLDLEINKNKIVNFKVEMLRLSDKIAGNKAISSILPKCFSDYTCEKEGQTARCNNPGTMNASCVFSQAERVPLLVIVPKRCIACNTEIVTAALKRKFPGLSVSQIFYPSPKAESLINNLEIKNLPAYLLGKEVEKETTTFESLKNMVEEKSDFYLLKPQYSGIALMLDRNRIKNKFDIFISLFDESSPRLLENVKEFKPEVHFLVLKNKEGKFDSAKGIAEVEEDLRSVCVKKYYPADFWDYISCRAKNIQSSWWQDCAEKFDQTKIQSCAHGTVGQGLLEKDADMNKEFMTLVGPVFVLNNQEIFSSNGAPSKEELRRVIKR
jgi:hypothetical protein